MFLKKVEVFGFKSFMNKLELEFGDGITCVIGPNGCGKSNISDAIRWVLGEQNPRLLRGETMDDVIFNGTRSRKPLGMAEVSLILSNDSRILPIDYSEVRVTRRVYRSGVSEYLINRNNCRLKDLRHLFMDTGLGSSSYTVMERSMVDSLLGNTSVNLRTMLEEAAGIMKYKTQEKLALRKLDATENDLLRIRDIVAEVEKRVRSLKRQIGKADRHNELSAAIRRLAVYGARLELERLTREEGDLSVKHKETMGRQGSVSGRLAGLEAEVQRQTLEVREMEADLRVAQGALNTTLGSLEKLSSEMLVLREREKGIKEHRARLEREIEGANRRIEETVQDRWKKIEGKEQAVARIRALEGELEEKKRESSLVRVKVEKAKNELLQKKQITLDLFRGESEKRNEVGNLETTLAGLQSREEGLGRHLAALEAENGGLEQHVHRATGQHESCTRELEKLRAERDDSERELEQLRVERAEVAEKFVLLQGKRESLEATHHLLIKLHDEYEGYRNGVRSLLTHEPKHDSVLGVVGELIEVEPSEYRAAFENALTEALQCVIVSGEGEALDLLRFLRDNEKGWATLLPKDRFPSLPVELPDDLRARDGVVGPASRFIRSSEGLGDVIGSLLGTVVFVEDMDRAIDLAREQRFRSFQFVTPSGEGARFPGVLFGGRSGGDDLGIFERRSRIAELEAELAEVVGELKRTEVRTKRLDEGFDRSRIEKNQLVAELDRAVGRAEEASREKERLRTALEKGRETVSRVRSECEVLGREKQSVRRRLETVASEFRSIGADGSEADRSLREIEAEMVELEMSREEARRCLTSAQVALAEAEGSKKSLEAEVGSLDRREQELVDEVTRKREDLVRSGRTIEEIGKRAAELEEREAGLSGQKEIETARRDEILVEVNRINDAIRVGEESARRDRKERERLAEQLHRDEMRLQEIKLGRENLFERTAEEYEISEEEIAAAEPAEGKTEEGMRAEVQALRESLRRLGPVNLVAIDEFEEESERCEFLKEQEADLIRARDSLRETIRTVDSKARTLFVETFERVRRNFQEVFGNLFEGGEADLMLVNPEEPLLSDLEIIARPGHKRPQRIALLSGGERALTAISLLFALYLEKPSPFCVLDELDAPLDDANVRRFLNMLKRFDEKTQFVVITHNRQTMESGDYLYGVTMQEPGVSRVVSVRLGRRGVAAEEEEKIRAIEGGGA